jgi:hypothetical protein
LVVDVGSWQAGTVGADHETDQIIGAFHVEDDITGLDHVRAALTDREVAGFAAAEDVGADGAPTEAATEDP